MEEKNIKKKISMEMDSTSKAEPQFSPEVKREIESNTDIREFAEDLLKIESLLTDVNETTSSDLDPEEIKLTIRNAIAASSPENGNVGELLVEPLPHSEDDPTEGEEGELVYPALGAAKGEEGPLGRRPLLSSLGAGAGAREQDMQADLARLQSMTARVAAPQEDSSGLLNLGALLEEHRKSMMAFRIEQMATLAAPRAAPSRGKRVVMIAIVAVLATIGAVAVIYGWKIGMKRPVAERVASLDHLAGGGGEVTSLARGGPTAATGSRMLEEGTLPSPQLTSKAEEQKGEETVAAGVQGAEAAKHKTRKKGIVAEVDEGEVGGPGKDVMAKKAESGKEEAVQTPKESSKGELMSLLDSATSRKTVGQETQPAGEAKKGGGRESTIPGVEELMGGKKGAEGAKEAPASDLPATLSKNEIRVVMQKLNPKIQKCGEGKVGTLILNLVVSSDGTVKSAKASGQFATDPTGKCAEKVAMEAKFPSFRNPTMNVTYPYVFAPPPGQ